MYFSKHLCTVNKPIQEDLYRFCEQRPLLVEGWQALMWGGRVRFSVYYYSMYLQLYICKDDKENSL